MADFGRGAKAGAIAGFIYGIVSVILTVAVMQVLFSEFWTGLGLIGGLEARIGIGVIIAGYAVMGIISGIIGGLIFGLIYAAIYNALPGNSSVVKGIVLSIVFWLILSVGFGFSMVAAGSSIIGAYLAIGLISSLIWGILMGKLWDSFR